MTTKSIWGVAALCAGAALVLAGCDRGATGSAQASPTPSHAGRARGPVPMFHGEPMWSDNRQHTAQENAQYHFERSGGEIGAKDLNDFLTKTHAFIDHPPAGVLKLTRPRNGDRLYYDPKTNLFAVARRDGAPRTIFKPRDGMAYWKEQQDRIKDEGSGGERRRRYASRDGG